MMRIKTLIDNPLRSAKYKELNSHAYTSLNRYDYAGERVVKGKGDGQSISVNGYPVPPAAFTGNYTMYVNAYLVVNGPRYTKHFYMEEFPKDSAI
jgi:hypothetical protein